MEWLIEDISTFEDLYPKKTSQFGDIYAFNSEIERRCKYKLGTLYWHYRNPNCITFRVPPSRTKPFLLYYLSFTLYYVKTTNPNKKAGTSFISARKKCLFFTLSSSFIADIDCSRPKQYYLWQVKRGGASIRRIRRAQGYKYLLIPRGSVCKCMGDQC